VEHLKQRIQVKIAFVSQISTREQSQRRELLFTNVLPLSILRTDKFGMLLTREFFGHSVYRPAITRLSIKFISISRLKIWSGFIVADFLSNSMFIV
jgi:hypothetical protein